jgi:hypothetical protein
MEKQFFVYDKVSYIYTGQYFSVNKKLENSTDILPVSNICEWNGVEWVDVTNNNIECPIEVSLWKIRVVLKLMQLEDTVASALEDLEEPTKTAALYIWSYGTAIDRDSQTIAFLQAVLQLTNEQVDEIFIQANALKL